MFGFNNENIDVLINNLIEIFEDQSENSFPNKIKATEFCLKRFKQGRGAELTRLFSYLHVINEYFDDFYPEISTPNTTFMNLLSELNKIGETLIKKEVSRLKKTISDVTRETMNEFKDVQVPVYFVAKRIQQNEVIVRKLFQELIKEKEFPGEFDSDRDYMIFKPIQFKCYGCDAPLEKNEIKCNNCGLEMRKCMICKRIIYEVPAICPKCNGAAHEHHFLQWLKMDKNEETDKGTCPNCGTPLEPSDLKEENNLYKSYFNF
ncbi:MAG: hypothetical protein ACTSVE_08090 [Candidatus Helarchaeota archaeon]